MQPFEINQRVNILDGEPQPMIHNSPLFAVGDAASWVWKVRLHRNNAPVSIAGSVEAYFCRADGNMGHASGTADDGIASVVFPSSAFEIPGPVIAIMRVQTSPDAVQTIAKLCFSVQSDLLANGVIDPEIIPTLLELLDQVVELEAWAAKLEHFTAEAVTLEPGADATVEITQTADTTHIRLGVPKGTPGDPTSTDASGIRAKSPGSTSNDSYVQAELDAINALLNSSLKDALREFLYPVTIIVEFDGDIDPNVQWGGTWECWGNGRVVVGVDETDDDFKVSGKTGGVKLVSHGHNLAINSGGGGISGITILTLAQTPVHQHAFGIYFAAGSDATLYAYQSLGPNNGQAANAGTTSAAGSNGGHTHSTPDHVHTGTVESTDISTLQPYIAAKRWKRTA